MSGIDGYGEQSGKRFDVLRRRLWEHAVPEVKHIGSLTEHPTQLPDHGFERGTARD
jgi:hypothetical protein